MSPDEHAFFSRHLPKPLLPPLQYPQVRSSIISMFHKIKIHLLTIKMSFFQSILNPSEFFFIKIISFTMIRK